MVYITNTINIIISQYIQEIYFNLSYTYILFYNLTVHITLIFTYYVKTFY